MEKLPPLVVALHLVLQTQTGLIHGLQWSPSLKNGDTVYVCEGHDVTIPWDITPDSGEEIVDITWLFQGAAEQMIAVLAHRFFFAFPSYSGRADHEPNGGLVLRNVTQADAGNYTVQVKADTGPGAYRTYNSTVYVHVATESSARIDATVEVMQKPEAVYNRQTDQFHLQLTCSSRGWQPPGVMWTGPGQEDISTSPNENGDFTLLLPNPVSGGDYTCRLLPESPAARCLSREDPVLKGAKVHVDKTEAHLTLTDAEIFSLKNEKKVLQEKVATLLRRVVFYARLSNYTRVSDGNHVKPDGVYVNLGNGYNASTGDFTAPYDGYYFFVATAGASVLYHTGDDTVILYLVVNGDARASIWTKSVNYYEMGTCMTAARLERGDRVWLKARGDQTIGKGYTTFGGFLISAA